MRFFYDCEFIEDGTTIDLVSIGVVAEAQAGSEVAGAEFYAVSTEFDPRKAGDWVRRNVLNKLPNPADSAWKSRTAIRDHLYEFLREHAGNGSIEMWAWVGAYDHVVLCQLWGDMTALPADMPRFTRELRQLWDLAGKPKLPAIATDEAHSAVVDARHNLAKFGVIAAALETKNLNV